MHFEKQKVEQQCYKADSTGDLHCAQRPDIPLCEHIPVGGPGSVFCKHRWEFGLYYNMCELLCDPFRIRPLVTMWHELDR